VIAKGSEERRGERKGQEERGRRALKRSPSLSTSSLPHTNNNTIGLANLHHRLF
jgi:hypothetical protein